MKKVGILSLMIAVSTILNANNKQEVRLDETVVTATGFEGTQNNQIKNVTVVTREDIENKGYNSVEEVLRNTPGINFVYNGFGMVADIRGQGATEATKRVKILVDNIPMSILDLSHGLQPLNTIGLDSVEKIEVINGGGAVLYGSGTAGGVINIITNKSQENKTTGKVYYERSSYKTDKLGINTNIKLTDELSVNLGYENQNGYGYRDEERSDSNNYKLGLKYDINENNVLKIGASKYKQDYFETDGVLSTRYALNRKVKGTTESLGKLDREEYSLNYNSKVNDKFKYDVTAYMQETDRKYDQLTLDTLGGIPFRQDLVGTFKDKKVGINTKAEYKYDNGEVTFGYEYLNNKAVRNTDPRVISYSAVIPGRGIMNARHDMPTYINLKKETNSLFLLNRNSITNKLDSVFGYRFETAKYDVNRYSKIINTMTMMGRPIVNSREKELNEKLIENNSAYELGLNYKYSNTGNMYGKFERGFRSPSPTELTNSTRNTYTMNGVKSETYNTYELGIKDMLTDNVFVSATAFVTETKNEIYTELVNHMTGIFNTYNIPGTRRKGVELFSEQYLGKIRLNQSFTYVDAKISKGEEKGNKVYGVSNSKFTLGVNYEIIEGLKASVDTNYYGKYVNDRNQKQSSYAVTNTGISYKFKNGVGLLTGIKNVFDKKYNRFSYGSNGEFSVAGTYYLPAPERTYYLGISYEF